MSACVHLPGILCARCGPTLPPMGTYLERLEAKLAAVTLERDDLLAQIAAIHPEVKP